jgi:hypothetical protein
MTATTIDPTLGAGRRDRRSELAPIPLSRVVRVELS